MIGFDMENTLVCGRARTDSSDGLDSYALGLKRSDFPDAGSQTASRIAAALWVSLALGLFLGCTQPSHTREYRIQQAIAYRDALARLPTKKPIMQAPILKSDAYLSIALDQVCRGASGPILWEASMGRSPNSSKWLSVQWVSFLDSPPEIFIYNEDGRMIGRANSIKVPAKANDSDGPDASDSIMGSELLRVFEPNELPDSAGSGSDRILVFTEPSDSAVIIHIQQDGGSGSSFHLIHKSRN